ncbi:UvrD-helicase domain-containing protein [Amniculibacterium sp. G2-70]|uniref:UvrD-helicase domain-containing protein n=1 Tax=Amniculibacterium sp. G2-70 TaxID=2767188 RepID=UPI001654BC9B|nr:UvrD-helicase domain-containing protein [Amniculibacterium sp. G2-70]
MKNKYTVVNASAGSGKTYYLVQQVLLICLRHPNSEKKIGQILALTFTNKAANEMKERILSWLMSFVRTDCTANPELKNIQEVLAKEGIRLTLDDLQQRSKKLLDYILHHYSILNISTIDKFNTRLVRSFSNELGLAKNFNLEINSDPYLKEAIDQLLDHIGDDEFYTDLFLDYMNYQFENTGSTKLNDELFLKSKDFLGDKHYENLQKNKNFDIHQYIDKTKLLRAEIKRLKKDSLERANSVLDLLKTKDLSIEDFYGGARNGIALFFDKVSKFYRGINDKFPFPKDEESAVLNFEKLCSTKSKSREADVREILEYLLESRRTIINNEIAQLKNKSILSALLPLKVNKDIQDELQKIEDENDLVFLSKFNTLIKENLQNEPSAFIYEKIGTKFQYFFFDEFQDTSKMQWQNFVPLRDHAVSMDDTAFTVVGDPKQSIYRFRGGDSQLMLDIINKTEQTPVFADVFVLEDNWRSAKNIVEFNNALYDFLSRDLKVEHQKVFGKDASQNPRKTNVDGRVRVHLLENANRSVFFEEVADKMHQDIQQCLDNGFSFSDICILCRGNDEILDFSKLLGQKKVNYSGQEVFIKTLSEKGLTLNLSLTLKAVVCFLEWKVNTQNRRYLAEALYWLGQLGRINFSDFSEELSQLFTIKKDSLLVDAIEGKYQLNLDHKDIPQLNLYNFVEFYLKEFSVEEKETDFILNFLEILHAFSQSSGLTLKDFIQFWNDEGADSSIQASDNIDAVQLMTVHKAKGLEFPVVFYPLKNKAEKSFNNWLDFDDPVLSSVYVKKFSSEIARYDQQAEQFNEENGYEAIVDDLCVQYVATTRPVEQLFLYLEKHKESKDDSPKKNLGIIDFVKQFNTNNLDDFDLYPGDFSKKIIETKGGFNTQKIDTVFPKHQSISELKIATPSKNYQHRNEKVRRGIFIHDVLSKIETQKDVEVVLNDYLLNGLLTISEAKLLEKEIIEIISQNEDFFSDDLEVLNERELMISSDGDSPIFRPDRLMKTPSDEWMVVDFKTGVEKPEHQVQIDTYCNILTKLGKNIKAQKVIYIP